MTVVRHPFLGLLAGFLLGVGLALVLVQLSIVPFGPWTVIVTVVGLTLLGLVFALVIPVRGAPESGSASSSGTTYQPPAAPPPPPPAAPPPPASPPPAEPPGQQG